MHRWAALKALADTAAAAVDNLMPSRPGVCAFPNLPARAFAIETCRNAAHNIIALCDELQAELKTETDAQASSEAPTQTPAAPPPVAGDR